MLLEKETDFYKITPDSYGECIKRAGFLKDVIENKDGYRMFYDNNGKPIQKEEDLKIAYRLTWFGTIYSVDTEVNNGRGPADTIVAMGNIDASIVEFKLASNKKLKQNLENQAEIYEKARGADKSIKIILYFNETELEKVKKILKELEMENVDNIILIDASKKESASNVK